MDFGAIQGVISDMDGVLWEGSTPLPGLREFFAFLGERGLPYMLATNNSSRTPLDYARKLARLGVDVPPERILTSGSATASELQTRYAPGTRLYCIGGDGLKQLLTRAGFELADEQVAAVVVGLDVDFTYQKARRAALLIRAGAAFIGTNDDRTFPMEQGLAPGAGALIAMLETASDVRAELIGKPQPAMFQAALRAMGTTAAATLMIGDRLSTDIAGGAGVGLKTAFVLSGVNRREDVAGFPHTPDLIAENLAELVTIWRAALA